MKYRIQFSAVLNSANSNALLNQIESQKSDVFEPTYYTEVPIIRKAKKLESDENKFESELTEYASVDFDDSEDTHSHSLSGVDEYLVSIDVSFSDVADFNTCMNYIESIKDDVFSDKQKSCRNFECMHDSQIKPLPKDGAYTYVDFDGSQLTYPL